MSKFLSEGFFTSSRWHESPFSGVLFYDGMVNNGFKVSHPIMVISVAGNPGVGETIGMMGTSFAFVAAGATGAQIDIGATTAETATNIIAKFNEYRRTIQITAYALRKSTLILCVDNYARANTASPAFNPDAVPNVVEDTSWTNSVTEHMMVSADYFRIGEPWDNDTKPITLTTQRYGGATSPTYQNFLY